MMHDILNSSYTPLIAFYLASYFQEALSSTHSTASTLQELPQLTLSDFWLLQLKTAAGLTERIMEGPQGNEHINRILQEAPAWLLTRVLRFRPPRGRTTVAWTRVVVFLPLNIFSELVLTKLTKANTLHPVIKDFELGDQVLPKDVEQPAVTEHFKVLPAWRVDNQGWDKLPATDVIGTLLDVAKAKIGEDIPVLNYHNWHLLSPQPMMHSIKSTLFWDSSGTQLAVTLATSQHLITALDNWRSQHAEDIAPFKHSSDPLWTDEISKICRMHPSLQAQTETALKCWIKQYKCNPDAIHEVLSQHNIEKLGFTSYAQPKGDKGAKGAKGGKGSPAGQVPSATSPSSRSSRSSTHGQSTSSHYSSEWNNSWSSWQWHY